MNKVELRLIKYVKPIKRQNCDFCSSYIDSFNNWTYRIDKTLSQMKLTTLKQKYLYSNYKNGKENAINKLSEWNTSGTGEVTYGFSSEFQKCQMAIRNIILEIVSDKQIKNNSNKVFDIHNKKIFIIHGRDEKQLEQVSSFISSIGMEPIILKDEPKKGQFILPRITELGETCNIAIALLTADDVGKLRTSETDEACRARQNVIFELGYFINMLGTERVMTLYEKGVDIPSDILGRFYIEKDDNNIWQKEIKKEIASLGYKFKENING